MATKQNYLQFLHDEVWGNDEFEIDETKTQEYLQKLQDEALADRAWIKPEKLDGWDYQLQPFAHDKVNNLKDLQSDLFIPAMNKYFASGKLEKWLENKALSTKDEQESKAFNKVLNRVREIPKDSTRLEVMKALYQIIFDKNEILPQMEVIFESAIRWGALENEYNRCLDVALVLSKELRCDFENDGLSEELEHTLERTNDQIYSLEDYTDVINEMQDNLVDKVLLSIDDIIGKKIYDDSQNTELATVAYGVYLLNKLKEFVRDIKKWIEIRSNLRLIGDKAK